MTPTHPAQIAAAQFDYTLAHVRGALEGSELLALLVVALVALVGMAWLGYATEDDERRAPRGHRDCLT